MSLPFCPSTVVCRAGLVQQEREHGQDNPVPCRSATGTAEVKVPLRAALSFPLRRVLTFEPGAVPALRLRADEVLPPSLLVCGSSVWLGGF